GVGHLVVSPDLATVVDADARDVVVDVWMPGDALPAADRRDVDAVADAHAAPAGDRGVLDALVTVGALDSARWIPRPPGSAPPRLAPAARREFWITAGRAGEVPPCAACAALALGPERACDPTLLGVRDALLGTVIATEVVKRVLAIGVPFT